MANKAINFIIPFVVYPFDVMVSICEDDKALASNLKATNIDADGVDLVRKRGQMGRCIMFDGGQLLIRLYKPVRTPEDRGYLSHEIFHAVEFLMDRIGMKLGDDSGEAFAYAIQHLTTEIYKKM